MFWIWMRANFHCKDARWRCFHCEQQNSCARPESMPAFDRRLCLLRTDVGVSSKSLFLGSFPLLSKMLHNKDHLTHLRKLTHRVSERCAQETLFLGLLDVLFPLLLDVFWQFKIKSYRSVQPVIFFFSARVAKISSNLERKIMNFDVKTFNYRFIQQNMSFLLLIYYYFFFKLSFHQSESNFYPNEWALLFKDAQDNLMMMCSI